MDDELKKKAYLEAQKLKSAGYDFDIILARLDKMGIPEDLAEQVVKNIAIQHIQDSRSEMTPFYNIALFKVGIGVVLAIVSYIIAPGILILPIGFIATGIALAWKNRPV
jgi:VIT1/CCC1 family predicted Fe2+/Mn2+ transporter